VSREIGRNGGRRAYRASAADQAAWHRATRPKLCKLAQNPVLARVVADKLQLEWSLAPLHAEDGRSWSDHRDGVDP